jgi:hypothetical protein
VCLSAVPAGQEAEWNSGRQTVVCGACVEEDREAVRAGRAGGSAQARAERLLAAQRGRHRRLKEDHPVLGRLKLALAAEPEAGRSWARGAVGEQKFGAALDTMVDQGVLILHDRRLPRSKANLDHLAVSSMGVWVIDAKRYRGRVTKVDNGGWLRPDIRLMVAGRDRTPLVRGVQRQVEHVRAALAELTGEPITVRGALCFVDSDFGYFARPLLVDDIVISWGKGLRKRLLEPGPLSMAQRAVIHRHLATSFPPAA